MKKMGVLSFIAFSIFFLSGCFGGSFYEGEWESKAGGYFVFNNDNTFEWYLDETKDKNIVTTGTWKTDVLSFPEINLDSEKNPAGTDNKKYETIVLNMKYHTQDGDKKPYPVNSVTQFLVLEKSENKLTIMNLRTFSAYEIQKKK